MSRPAIPPGSRACLCAACKTLFSSPTGFDRHQRLTDTGVECRKPVDVGLVQLREHDGVPVWGQAPPGYAPAYWGAA